MHKPTCQPLSSESSTFFAGQSSRTVKFLLSLHRNSSFLDQTKIGFWPFVPNPTYVNYVKQKLVSSEGGPGNDGSVEILQSKNGLFVQEICISELSFQSALPRHKNSSKIWSKMRSVCIRFMFTKSISCCAKVRFHKVFVWEFSRKKVYRDSMSGPASDSIRARCSPLVYKLQPRCYYFPPTARKLWAGTSGRLSAEWAIIIPALSTICMTVKIWLVIWWDDVIDKKRVTANYTNTTNCASFCLRALTSQRENAIFLTEPWINRLNCKSIKIKRIKHLSSWMVLTQEVFSESNWIHRPLTRMIQQQ